MHGRPTRFFFFFWWNTMRPIWGRMRQERQYMGGWLAGWLGTMHVPGTAVLLYMAGGWVVDGWTVLLYYCCTAVLLHCSKWWLRGLVVDAWVRYGCVGASVGDIYRSS